MRVRLYEIGNSNKRVAHHFDRFPAVLTLSTSGEVTTSTSGSPGACELDDVGGQILIKCCSNGQPVSVNDRLLESGPLMPGDQLLVGTRRFVVSYERTATQPPPGLRVRIIR